MSNTSDDNSTNESLASSSNSSNSHPIVAAIKSSMLRPSTLLSSASAAGTATSTATATETATATVPKSFLRPASFQVDSTTKEAVTVSPDASNSNSTSTPTPEDAQLAAAVDSDNTVTKTATDATPASATVVATASAAATPSSSSSTGSPVVTNPFLLAMMKNGEADSDTAAADDADHNGSGAAASSGSTAAAPVVSAQPTNGQTKTANLFKTTNATISTTTRTGPTDFVFGQNLHERVTNESINNDCTSSSSTSSASSNQLFAIAASTSAAAAIDKAASNSAGTEATVESLSEVARQYEESRAQKRKYEEVETFTGEEDETNVMDVNCKLFAFVASNWEERGPGNLRVNDNKDRQKSPRVVFRTSGNLRVLLNTKIWPGMVVERPSQKSLRFSAIEADGQIRIFLAMARPDDITILVKQLIKRINLEKSRPVPVAVTPEPVAKIYLDPAVVDIQTDAEIEAVDSTSGSTTSAPESASTTGCSGGAKESVGSAVDAVLGVANQID